MGSKDAREGGRAGKVKDSEEERTFVVAESNDSNNKDDHVLSSPEALHRQRVTSTRVSTGLLSFMAVHFYFLYLFFWHASASRWN